MRVLLMVVIVALTVYGPLELTRVIIAWELTNPQFIFELGFIWLCYLVAMTLIAVLLKEGE